MPKPETNTRKIIAKLISEGWQNVGGTNHDRFIHPDRRGVMITVPRHRELTPGTARSIAKAAGWM
jgi:predicted RNA binding protein YcfA (HicA-like mRNA interferase family)